MFNKAMRHRVRQFVCSLHSSGGQSLVEYSVILALVAAVTFLILRNIGTTVNNSFDKTNNGFQ